MRLLPLPQEEGKSEGEYNLPTKLIEAPNFECLYSILDCSIQEGGVSGGKVRKRACGFLFGRDLLYIILSQEARHSPLYFY